MRYCGGRNMGGPVGGRHTLGKKNPGGCSVGGKVAAGRGARYGGTGCGAADMGSAAEVEGGGAARVAGVGAGVEA